MIEIDVEADIRTPSGLRGIKKTVLSVAVPRKEESLFFGDETDWQVNDVEWYLDAENCLRPTLYLGVFDYEVSEMFTDGWTERD